MSKTVKKKQFKLTQRLLKITSYVINFDTNIKFKIKYNKIISVVILSMASFSKFGTVVNAVYFLIFKKNKSKTNSYYKVTSL